MSRHVLCSALVVATLTLTACVQTQDEHSPAAQAIADLRARAEAGDAGAQFILGGMYVIGDSVPPDAAEAVAWYRRAAEQGHARAQYNLGGLYREGLGVPPQRSRGAAAPPSRATRARSTTSEACMPRAEACPRMPSKPSCGSPSPPLGQPARSVSQS